MKNTATRFAKGAQAPFVGFKSLFSGPRIFLLALVPALVSSGVFVFGLTFGLGHVSVWLSLLAPLSVGFWGTLLNWSVTFLGYVFFVILLMLSVFVITKIVVIPFNSLIAEKVLKHNGNISDQPFRFALWMQRSIRMALWAVVQVIFFLVLGGGLFVLSFVPVLNLLVAFLGFLVVAFDCADYAMDVAELDFRGKLALMKRRLPEFCGFAAVMGLTFLIPFLNFFLLPVSVSGASWLVGTFDELWAKQRTH